MAKSVREPIQVYLTSDEREVLDRCAAEQGISRSEVLRRGLQAVGAGGDASGPSGGRRAGGRASPDHLTEAVSGPGSPPPSLPVASLGELLEELTRDRSGR